jgi:hypothetical protein
VDDSVVAASEAAASAAAAAVEAASHDRLVQLHLLLEETLMGARLSYVAAIVAASCCIVLAPAPASAQGPQQACAGDIAAYCPGIPQGGGKIAQCLRANEQKLSPGCRRGMAQMASMMKEVVGACEDDMHRYCAGAAPGAAKECLRANFRNLSTGCKRELFEAKKAM